MRCSNCSMCILKESGRFFFLCRLLLWYQYHAQRFGLFKTQREVNYYLLVATATPLPGLSWTLQCVAPILHISQVPLTPSVPSFWKKPRLFQVASRGQTLEEDWITPNPPKWIKNVCFWPLRDSESESAKKCRSAC